ncbi:MAG: DegT/DnrJ/EryC1/StrS family aminotransferase [bacterium]
MTDGKAQARAVEVPYVDIAAQHASIREELLEAVGGVLDSGHFVLGEEVSEFEKRFAALCGAKYAVGVASGTDALVLSLKAVGVGPGDEVISAPNSFVASATATVMAGARPVFVDVRDDYNIDPDLLESAITPRTKAILPVHLTGRPADMDPILEIAQRRRLHVIEDAAQAVIAEYRGRRVGSLGSAGCFSFHPLKTLNACGDGGAVTTNDAEIFQKLLTMRNLGLRTRDDCESWSPNSRLDTVQAAILLVKMKYLEEWTEKRRSNAAFYQKSLAGTPGLKVPVDSPNENAAYHTFIVQAERRDELKEHLAGQGIGSAIHYPVPIHLQTVGKDLGYSEGSFPVTEQQAKSVLSLPVHHLLSREQLEHVSDTIRGFHP